MNAKRFVALILVFAVTAIFSVGNTYAQEGDENTEAISGPAEVVPSAPDEAIGDAVEDPSQILDAGVEPDPYALEEEVKVNGLLEPAGGNEALVEDAILSDGIPVQGRVSSTAGAPLHGSYDITLALYTVAAGGTALCIDTDTVAVVNGLFTAVLNGCTTSDISGQQLYLGIKVGSDPEMTPRQPVYATPYAHSLRPDAIINNTGTGHGLTVQSASSGLANTALVAENTNMTSGIALRAIVHGNDAAMVSSNGGTGPLLKGFGGDGGEDEFRINNDGTLETKADSYLWIPGDAFIKNRSTDSTRWDIQNNGSALIWRGSSAGTKFVYIPITLPSVLYGQPVEIERITVYYRCQNGANNYITETYMYKQTSASGQVTLIGDGADHKSDLASSYTLTLETDDRYLSAGQGGLGLNIGLNFANDSEYIQLGGIRLQLGHHELY